MGLEAKFGRKPAKNHYKNYNVYYRFQTKGRSAVLGAGVAVHETAGDRESGGQVCPETGPKPPYKL